MKLALVLVSLLGPLTTHAKCAVPQVFVLPRPGTPLPPNPTVFFFVPPDADASAASLAAGLRAVTESGQPLKLRARKLAGGGGLQVVRLSVEAASGARFHLEPAIPGAVDWPVTAAPTPPSSFEVTRGKDLSSKWMCSFEALRVLDTSLAAPAYRVDFAETEVQLRQGGGSSVVVEGAEDGFPRLGGKVPPLARAVRLGHHDCWGWNLEWSTPTLAVRITALLADGTERSSETVFMLDAPVPPVGWR